MKKIIILGFGNILMQDDGAGIFVIRRLLDNPPWEKVQLLDGGVASFEILDAARTADRIILIDSLAGGGLPGDLYRLDPEAAAQPAPFCSLSLHDGTLLQSLQLARCAGPFPPVTIYGIEPGQIAFGMTLTPPVAAAVDRLADILIAELQATNPAPNQEKISAGVCKACRDRSLPGAVSEINRQKEEAHKYVGKTIFPTDLFESDRRHTGGNNL